MPVNSTAAGCHGHEGQNLTSPETSSTAAGLPELEDQIGGAMVRWATSGQARAEYVATAVRDLQSFDVEMRDNRAAHHATNPVGAGTVFSRSIIDDRPDNAAPWRVEIEYASAATP